LRDVPCTADTPLVAVTGYAEENDRRRALSVGFTEHMAKPVTPESILECIERLCR
jgi:CheY-like chemotaxis protein